MSQNIFTLKSDQKSYPVKVIKIDDEVYFSAEDITLALGYKNLAGAIIAHCDPQKNVKRTVANKENSSDYFLPESEVYKRIQSDLNFAKAFKNWISQEVKPQIIEEAFVIGSLEESQILKVKLYLN